MLLRRTLATAVQAVPDATLVSGQATDVTLKKVQVG